MEKNKTLFKNSYIGIFSLNYFIQGINQSMFAVIVPIYLINLLMHIESSDIAFLTSIVLMPFAIKFIYGMLSDKYALKNFGRRKPWIIVPVSISGLIWILIPFIITENIAFMLFTVGGVLIVLGVAIADTAIDGLILDITPKEKLGRVQGTCWGVRSVGIIIGGPLIVIFYLLADANINTIFIGLGIIMILTSFTILIVKEVVTHVDFSMKTNLKLIFGTGKNWRVYMFAIFNSFVDGVIFVFLSLYIIIQAGFAGAEGADIEALGYNLYEPNAFISFFIGLGVILGAVIGGYIADLKTRKLGVYSSLLVTSASLLLFLIPTVVPILIFFAFLIGSSAGWRNSSYSAVIGQISMLYPEVDSTYYATCNSFNNIGTVIGLQLTGFLFGALAELSTYKIYAIIFIFMVIISNIGLIPFLTMDPKDYELSNKSRD